MLAAAAATIVVSAGLLGGCSAPEPVFPAVEPAVVWPPPPDSPRYSWVGELRGEGDLHRPRSAWGWLVDLVSGPVPPAEIRSAHGVAFHPPNVLWVSDPEQRVVHRFDLESRDYRALTDVGDGLRLETPIGLAVSDALGTDGALLVADRTLRVVAILSQDGATLAIVGRGELTAPVGVAEGSNGRIWVADVGTHQVVAFDPDGSVALTIGGRGIGPGEFNYPTHVTCDDDGNVYVSDTLNCRVQVFDRDGEFVRTWGGRGVFPGQFSQPKGIAWGADGFVYVVDSHFENVQVFTTDGQLLLAVGTEGTGPGEFWLPIGICVDPSHRVWIGDSHNRRVQVLQHLDFVDGATQHTGQTAP